MLCTKWVEVMKNRIGTRARGALVACVGVLTLGLMTVSAQAVPVLPASPTLGTACNTADFAGSIACYGEVTNPSNDTAGVPPPGVVNYYQIFGYNDWDIIEKSDENFDPNIGITHGGGTSGSWSISGIPSLMSAYTDFMLVGKAGGPGGGSWSAYLFDDKSKLSGGGFNIAAWAGGGLSHVSFYARKGGNGDGVPEPGPIGLLGLSLLGLGLLRRRKSA